jgi:hypothetical protein
VEAEVARRLEEREKEEEERREKEKRDEITKAKERSPKKEPRETLPSGVLTPLLKRHRDLDNELKNRLQELELKMCVLTFLCLMYIQKDYCFLVVKEVIRKFNWQTFSRLYRRRRQVVPTLHLREPILKSL